jgi:hypothetical protein
MWEDQQRQLAQQEQQRRWREEKEQQQREEEERRRQAEISARNYYEEVQNRKRQKEEEENQQQRQYPGPNRPRPQKGGTENHPTAGKASSSGFGSFLAVIGSCIALWFGWVWLRESITTVGTNSPSSTIQDARGKSLPYLTKSLERSEAESYSVDELRKVLHHLPRLRRLN